MQFFKTKFTQALLIINGYTYSIFFIDNTFFLFNSHATSEIGLTDPFGTASIIAFPNDNEAVEICNFIFKLHRENSTLQFSIEPVSIELIDIKNIKRENSQYSYDVILPEAKKSVLIKEFKLKNDLTITYSNCDVTLNTNWDDMYTKIQKMTLTNLLELKTYLFSMGHDIIKMIKHIRKIDGNNVYNNQEKTHSYQNILEINKIDKFKIPILTIGDGNCCYRALAIVLFGNQIFYKIIKICIIFTLIEYLEYFEILIRKFDDLNINEYILKHARDKIWTDDYINQAAAIMCDRPVVSFALRQTRKLIVFNSNKYNTQIPICMIFSHDKYTTENGHFTGLLDVDQNSHSIRKLIKTVKNHYLTVSVKPYDEVYIKFINV